MKITKRLAASALAVSLALPAKSQETEGPVYLLASLQVPDLETYLNDYGFLIVPMLLQAGGEILMAASQVSVLEGEYSSNWSVVVRFPKQAAADGWYISAEYQVFIPVRQGLTDIDASTMVIAPQFVIPQQ